MQSMRPPASTFGNYLFGLSCFAAEGGSKIPSLGIGIAPKDDLQGHGLEPGLVHLFYVLGGMPFAGQEVPNRMSNRYNKSNQVA